MLCGYTKPCTRLIDAGTHVIKIEAVKSRADFVYVILSLFVFVLEERGWKEVGEGGGVAGTDSSSCGK